MIRERLLKIIELEVDDLALLESKTGISRHTWGNLRAGRQRANEDQIEAFISVWPHYAYWITTGLTIPDAGQISPELEKVRKKL